MKRVAIEQGLEEIKQELENRGYEIVDYKDKGHIDAIVYKNINDDIGNINNSTDGNIDGAILVNANNKTIDEIEYVIRTRKYEKLFI